MSQPRFSELQYCFYHLIDGIIWTLLLHGLLESFGSPYRYLLVG